VTNRENAQHAHDNGLHSTQKTIIQYDLNMNKINEFNSQMEASRKLNLSDSSIGRCCRGIQKSTGGFIFKFEN
jgi:hypothetical protein